MKNRYLSTLASSLVLGSSHAATITASTDNPPGGQGYTYHITLNSLDSDTTSFQGTVGSWSWEDSRLPGEGTFWRHQSDWIAITLTQDTILNLQAQRSDAVTDNKLFPSFTIFRGFNDTTEGPHFGSNTSDLQWEATSQLLEYVGHHQNSTLGAIDENMALTAGDYTILFGGNALSEADAVNVNYLMTLSASPIPEPSSSLLGIFAGMILLTRRQRHQKCTK